MWYVKKDYRTLNRIVTVIIATISIYVLKTFFIKIFLLLQNNCLLFYITLYNTVKKTISKKVLKVYAIMTQKIVLPRKTMYEDEILGYVNLLAIPNFRCVKMRDDLPAKPWKKECGILNLDSLKHEGTHWVAWYKNGKERYYFDSFGQYPPFELLHYLSMKE